MDTLDDLWLWELDRRLASIEHDLAGRAEASPAVPFGTPPPAAPPPPAPRVAAAPAPAAALVERLAAAAHAQDGLVTSLRALVEDLDRGLARLAPLFTVDIALAVGPLGTVAAARAFASRLRTLPEVQDARVRGYAGSGTTIIDVSLRPARA